jgi:hypothetical protein
LFAAGHDVLRRRHVLPRVIGEMEDRSLFVLALALVLASAACSSSSPASPGADTGGEACPLSSSSDLPTGACTTEGCMEVHARVHCSDGTWIDASEFACSCVAGAWSCEVNGGGFNLPVCPDAGADGSVGDAGAEVLQDGDKADACPASTAWFDGACRKLCLPSGSSPDCATNEACDMSAGCFANCDPMDCSTVCWGVCAPVHGD